MNQRLVIIIVPMSLFRIINSFGGIQKPNVYLVVRDSVFFTEENDQSELIKRFGDKLVVADTFDLSDGYKIDLSRLTTNTKKVKFKYRSGLPTGSGLWNVMRDENMAAILGFSRIIFDQNKEYGVFNAGYIRGRLNGFGLRIFIKKNDKGKWFIDGITETWIS